MTFNRNPLPIIILLLCTGSLLSGCGQKGPLYLPEPEKPEPIAAPSIPTPQEQITPEDQHENGQKEKDSVKIKTN